MGFIYSLRKMHGRIHDWRLARKQFRIEYQTFIYPLERKLRENPNLAILSLTPEHGNMGDQAIAHAEQRFLDGLGIPYVELSGYFLEKVSRHNAWNIFNGHPILMNGGGYLGTLWFHSEKIFRTIIQNNPDSVIIALPNTLYYEDSEFGQTEFQKSVKIYNNHHSLYLFARERISFDAMKKSYKNVSLMPDMVLSLNECSDHSQRHGCMLCLRNDLEKTRNVEEDALIDAQAAKLFGTDILRTDMIEGDYIPISQRRVALEKKFAEFRSAELVITDRLHGMIFCAITATPCIAIESKSHKLRGCYEWIRNLPYIKLISDPHEISSAYHALNKHPDHYDPSFLSKQFEQLGNMILSYIQKG